MAKEIEEIGLLLRKPCTTVQERKKKRNWSVRSGRKKTILQEKKERERRKQTQEMFHEVQMTNTRGELMAET